jgi:hypothetical protein
VAPRVFLDAFVGINKQQGGLGIGGAGDHVLEKLLVSRRIDDDILAFGRPEPDLGGVDGDVLIAFGLEGVHQVGPFEWRRRGVRRRRRKLLEFTLWKRAGVME